MTPQEAMVRDRVRVPEGGLAELASAFDHEAALARQLREALVRQRAGVARNRPDDVHASCDDMGRVIVALEHARARRARVLESLTGRPDTAWEGLVEALEGRVPESLARSRARLRADAEAVAREAGTNREVLRRGVESGEAFLQALFSNVAASDATYRPAEGDDGAPGFLVDRKA